MINVSYKNKLQLELLSHLIGRESIALKSIWVTIWPVFCNEQLSVHYKANQSETLNMNVWLLKNQFNVYRLIELSVVGLNKLSGEFVCILVMCKSL